jgi:hypothetical protein
MQTVFKEFGDMNASRAYPFIDGCSRGDHNDVVLRNNFILDVLIQPRGDGDAGFVYLSKIDFPRGRLVFSFSVSRKVAGIASFSPGDNEAEIIDRTTGLPSGHVMLGGAWESVSGGGAVREFEPGATPLVPSVVFPVSPTGVVGFKLPDGAIMTGDVTLVGADGVNITSFVDAVCIDCRNTASSDRVVPIKRIAVTTGAGSWFAPSAYGKSVLALTSLLDMDDSCAINSAQHARRVREAHDPCPPEPGVQQQSVDDKPAEPIKAAETASAFFYLYPENSTITLVAPSTFSYRNPVSLLLFENMQAPEAINTLDVGDGARAISDISSLSSRPKGGIVLEMAGHPRAGRGDRLL